MLNFGQAPHLRPEQRPASVPGLAGHARRQALAEWLAKGQGTGVR